MYACYHASRKNWFVIGFIRASLEIQFVSYKFVGREEDGVMKRAGDLDDFYFVLFITCLSRVYHFPYRLSVDILTVYHIPNSPLEQDNVHTAILRLQIPSHMHLHKFMIIHGC